MVALKTACDFALAKTFDLTLAVCVARVRGMAVRVEPQSTGARAKAWCLLTYADRGVSVS
jgi:hypothetical protein